MKMNKLLCSVILLFSFIFIIPPSGTCWTIDTHTQLTNYAVTSYLLGPDYAWYFNLDYYLSDNLYPYFSDEYSALNKIINGRKVLDWIEDGAKLEDDLLRPRYHFHNPLLTWDVSGYSYGLLGPYTSSIIWSQSPIGQNNLYSWRDARDNYYSALTAATDAARAPYYQKMFQSLGAVMHLVEDAAVPDHTRNQSHMFDGTIEKYVQNNVLTTLSNPLEIMWTQTEPVFPYSTNNLAPVHIAQLFDTDQYSGSNPNITADPAIGIAEYSHTNFVTNDTIFTPHPYPSLTGTEPNTQAPGYLRKYQDGIVVEHFLKKKIWYVDAYLPNATPYTSYALDNTCYQDYASLLLPKAISYAAMVPYYFFRAEISGWVSDSDNNDPPTITFTICNYSSELMNGGTIEIFYEATSGSYVKLSSTPGAVTISAWGTADISLTLHSNWINGGSYYIVYRGPLGSESDAVVGCITGLPM